MTMDNNSLSAITIICTAVTSIITAILGYVGGRVHQGIIQSQKDQGAPKS